MLPTPELIARLQTLRERYGKPMSITSGARCKKHNKAVGGAANSQHTLGTAVDIACTNDRDRYRLVQLAFELGWGGVAFTETFVHLDIRPVESGAAWIY